MAGNLAPFIKQQFFDDNGDPLASGFIYSYQAGTTTPQATYSSSTISVPTQNTNPVELDANGEAAIWLDPTLSYKFVIKDSDLNTLTTVDNVIGTLTSEAVNTAALQDDCVTQAKIADDAVGTDQLQDDASVDANRAVNTNHIRDSAITAEKLAVIANPLNVGLSASVGSNALTVALKTAAGADATSTTPIRIPFRSSTATTGTPVIRNVTGALSVVVSSGSTLGHASAVNQYVYVYAIDNAGTVELAVSGQRLSDEQSLVTTTAEGGAGAADSATTLYSTTARSNVAVQFLGRLKSNQATAGTWASSITEISVGGARHPQLRSDVWVYAANGYGATNTKIRRWTTIDTNIGSAITYADDANAGGSFTINENGLYVISYTDCFNNQGQLGISRNSNQLTTAIGSITAAHRLMSMNGIAANVPGHCTTVCNLFAGDVIRAHTEGTATGTLTGAPSFRIIKVGE